jgi:dCMP deaminase
MKRPSFVEYGMLISIAASSRSACLRRNVGCVLFDRHRHILATGYNGPATGVLHCQKCKRENVESGERMHECEAIHAEQNALLQCSDTNKIASCVCTHLPCPTCLRLLMNTSCHTIFFLHTYPDDNAVYPVRKVWKNSALGRGFTRDLMRIDIEDQIIQDLFVRKNNAKVEK